MGTSSYAAYRMFSAMPLTMAHSPRLQGLRIGEATLVTAIDVWAASLLAYLAFSSKKNVMRLGPHFSIVTQD